MSNSIMGTVERGINSLLSMLNLRIVHLDNRKPYEEKIRINIGSGDWSCEGWLNLDYTSDWYKKNQESHKIISYDIRTNKLPFDDNCVEAIYCSHVVEHIENEYIQVMFNECYRTMTNGGGFRIACPDAEYLYQISQRETDFWAWRNSWFESPFYELDTQPRQVDYLVREIATPKLLGYKNAINSEDFTEHFSTMNMDDFLDYLVSGLYFRKEYTGDHINYFTYSKIKAMLKLAGFEVIIRSKHLSSASREMGKAHKFDLTHPEMSLYVEAIK